MLDRTTDFFMVQKADGSLARTTSASVLALIAGTDIEGPYEGLANTNKFTDALLAKLNSIDATHYLPPVQSIADVAAMAEASLTDKARVYVEDNISDYFYDAQATAGDIAPTDQTGGTGFWRRVEVTGETPASIKAKYESNADTNALTDALLASIGANVTATAANAAATASNTTDIATNAAAIAANTAAQHDEATIAGDATTNPIVIGANQVFSFDFSSLPVA